MPANGLHASAMETGELPVYEDDCDKEPAPWRSSQFADTRYDLPPVPIARPYYNKAA